ncbi:hypothetical protein M0J40_RS14020 [Providencia rettgeri]|nr:hypothetical protein [Providencia rettgeri]ELR5126811.1 hypothetical protein [Providencia rettgeri]ELR5243342.1 hypothetical protein [Providencia rettgeri]ELR5257744.1 hypothetical protein [Providencia rettgeri]ELS4585002.1 hypothetical protein [Providencia rettgeri]
MKRKSFNIAEGIQREKKRKAPLSPEEKKERNNKIKKDKKVKLEYEGFIPTEINLGHDVFSKLAVIYQTQLGIELKAKGKNIDYVSKVISFCITMIYERMYAKKFDLPRITPARNYESQKLYDLFQIASYRLSVGDNESEVYRALRTKYKQIPIVRGNAVRNDLIPTIQNKNFIYDLTTPEEISKLIDKINKANKNTE